MDSSKNSEKKTPLLSKERIALIHEGNAVFNKGDIRLAEKIFRTARYQDGLIRTGQHYFKDKKYFHAAELFRIAKYLKGEYACYAKIGLCDKLMDTADIGEKRMMDEMINKRLAKAVSKMLQIM